MGGEYPKGGCIFEVEIAPRLLQPENFYVIGSCQSKNSHFQLILKLPIRLQNGETRILKVLVDTGAEANLVKLNLLPNHLFSQAPSVLKFRTANGQVLAGGDRVIQTSLGFTQSIDGVQQKELLELNAVFYEADIQVDAILSYPWMVSTKIGVFPHKGALAMEYPHLTLLYGLGEHEQKKKKKKWVVHKVENEICAIDVGGVQVPVLHNNANKKGMQGNATWHCGKC